MNLPIPSGLSLSMVKNDIAIIDELTKPASSQEFDDCIEKLTEFIRGFGDPKTPLESVANFYRIGLRDLPAEPLLFAVMKTIGSYKYQGFPKPAYIKEFIEHDLGKATLTKLRLKSALGKMLASDPLERLKEQARNHRMDMRTYKKSNPLQSDLAKQSMEECEAKIKELTDKQPFEKIVDGSNGAKHTVRRVNSVWTCTCESFTFCKGPDKTCKHIDGEKNV